MTAAFFLFALAASGASGLQSVLDDYREAQDIPGVSAVVVSDDKVLFSGASGVANLKSAAPMSADSVLYIGSVSKVLTAVLVLQLVEAKELSFGAPIGGVGLDQVTDHAPISLAHLLSHSAGLEREGNFGYWFTADFPDNTALSEYLGDARLRSEPGATLHYSNIGYAVLGQLIEQATGKSYTEALTKRVLAPLQMTASGARGPAADAVMGYTPVGRILPSSARPFAGIGASVGGRHERSYHDARAMSPAFGAYASATDMGKFLRFLLGAHGDDVMSTAMRARMFERQSSGRGLGLKIDHIDGRRVARHDGWFAAHRTHLLLDTENKLAVAVMANSDNASPGEIAEALLDAALRTD